MCLLWSNFVTKKWPTRRGYDVKQVNKLKIVFLFSIVPLLAVARLHTPYSPI